MALIRGCSDGSLVILHSTPSMSRSSSPGGVQLSDLGESPDCVAYQLAQQYMSEFYPEWSGRYEATFRAYEDYTAVDGENAGRFTWHLDGTGVTDPDGYVKLSAEEILADLFG